MGILRVVQTHPELPREPIVQALTGALPRGKYRLPSITSPLFMWSIPLVVSIVSISDPGNIDYKPLVRSPSANCQLKTSGCYALHAQATFLCPIPFPP